MFQVAVPLSPSTSSVDQHSEGALSSNSINTFKFIESNVQTDQSVIEFGISRDILPHRSFSEDDIDLHHVIIDLHEGSSDIHIEKLSFKLSRASKRKLKKTNATIWDNDFNASSKLLKKLSNEFTNDATIHKYCYPLENQIYRVDCPSVSFTPFKTQNDNIRLDTIKIWLQGVNLKSHDYLNRPVTRDQILMSLTNKLNNVNLNENRKNVRAKIIDILDDLPISFEGTTRRTYLNRLANMLLNTLQRIKFGVGGSSINRYFVNLSQSGMRIFTSGIQPTEDELKVLVREELMDYVEKNKLENHLNRIENIEADIVDILLDLMDDIKSDRDGNAQEEIINVLRESRVFTVQSEELAKQILEQLKEMFNVVDESHITEKPPLKTESVIMYQNECHACDEVTMDNESQTSYEDNLKFYTLRISHVIDEWLNDLECNKPKFCNKFSRQAIIDDLAEDVVDRFKYLELNPPKHYFYDDLEHLKYQIFKWMSKLTGKINLASLETVPDLMRRISKIPLPFLSSASIHNFKNENHMEETRTDSLLRLISDRSSSTESFKQSCQRCFTTSESSTLSTDKPVIMNTPRRMSQLSMFAPSKLSTQQNVITIKEPVQNETNYDNPGKFSSIYISLKKQDNLQVPNAFTSQPSTSPSNLLIPSKSLKELNEEYDTFVKNWTYQIPIPSSTPEEHTLAKNLRLGVYNGVWKSVAKLKSHPANIFNPFYYQDLLEDELEDIFNLLPQTQELTAKKHYLKVQFIEKTVNINDQIKESFAPEIFKQDLVRSVLTHVPRTKTSTADEDPVKLQEELEILQLAEIYILHERFKDKDQLKANVFRTKLVKRLEEVVDELKATHQKELQHIDRDLYINELLSAMQQVPLPSDNTIKAEADEILLGMEIEQWMGDLPLASIGNTRELFTRRRLKDNLAKKIYNLEKSVNISDSEGDFLLRMEISAMLDKLPLHKDQSLNLNFMVEELTNRIKNLNKYGTRSFNASDSSNYADFSKQVPKASSNNALPVPNQCCATSGHQSMNTPKTNTIPNSGTTSSMPSGNRVLVPYAQPGNGVNEQAILPGLNAQSSSGQIPMSHCNGNSNLIKLNQWQSTPNALPVAGELRGQQPSPNIVNAGGNQWKSGPILPQRQETPKATLCSPVSGLNAYQSFLPPSTSTPRSQQVQSIQGFKSMEASTIDPVQHFQAVPNPQQPPISAIADGSMYFGQRLAAPVQNAPLYTSNVQQKPASSSFYPGQEINQSGVQSSGFHESGNCSHIGVSHVNNTGSHPVPGHFNIIGQPSKVNKLYQVPADSSDFHSLPIDSQQQKWPCSIHQVEIPDIAREQRQLDQPNILNQSYQPISSHQGYLNPAVLPTLSGPPSQLGPKYYRSTDPQGIKDFTEQNMKNLSQVHNQQDASQSKKLITSHDCCRQTSPANYGQVLSSLSPVQVSSSSTGPVTFSASNETNVQANSSEPKQGSLSPCPGQSCPVLKRAMESQCPEIRCFFDGDDWDQEDLNIRCRCLERFRKRRIRRFDYVNPMYRYISPCFCFPEMT